MVIILLENKSDKNLNVFKQSQRVILPEYTQNINGKSCTILSFSQYHK